MQSAQRTMNPPWWTDEHTSSWERVKHALHRDWEQTKGDLADNGVDLNQGASDTIRQAVGKQEIPPDGFPNPGPRHGGPTDWNALEPALRFGYGARHHYADRVWDEELTTQLRQDWESSQNAGTWESVRLGIERGWHSVRRAL
jgi:hypothetical protein